jgi:hypothetical protein
LALNDVDNWLIAFPAWFGRTFVDEQFLPEITRLPIAIAIVAQGSAPLLNRFVQHRADCLRELFQASQRNSTRLPSRMYTRTKQRLIRVNIADTRNYFAVHDVLLNGDLSPARGLPQIFTGESVFQWFRSQSNK